MRQKKGCANKSDKKSPIFRTPLPAKGYLLDGSCVPAGGTFPIIILWECVTNCIFRPRGRSCAFFRSKNNADDFSPSVDLVECADKKMIQHLDSVLYELYGEEKYWIWNLNLFLYDLFSTYRNETRCVNCVFAECAVK
jgi:hypothetical protein